MRAANPKQWFHHHELCTTVCSAEILISALPTKKARKEFLFTPLKISIDPEELS